MTRMELCHLITVPTIVIAHLEVLTNTGIFLRGLKVMRRKQNLASALGIQKENWG